MTHTPGGERKRERDREKERKKERERQRKREKEREICIYYISIDIKRQNEDTTQTPGGERQRDRETEKERERERNICIFSYIYIQRQHFPLRVVHLRWRHKLSLPRTKRSCSLQ